MMAACTASNGERMPPYHLSVNREVWHGLLLAYWVGEASEIVLKQLAVTIAVIAGGWSAPAGANDFPYGKTLGFTIYRNGQEVGSHTLSFHNGDVHRTITIAVNIAVKSLSVIAYRYSHTSKEMWKRDALQELEARTDDNGRMFSVRAQRDARGLAVERVTPPQTASATVADQGLQAPEISRELLPATILPTSNWNSVQVRQSVLLNTQYGTRSHVKIVPIGREPVKTASGLIVEAMRYQYTGDLRMDQWFDDRGRWVKASFKAFDGSTIEYVLQE